MTIREIESHYAPFLVEIESISPTQRSVGFWQVRRKVARMNRRFSRQTFVKYLKKKVAPAVIGPGGKIYILDRHHTTRAVWESDIPHELKKIYVHIKHDWSNLPPNEFWVEMKSRGHVFGDSSQLPVNIGGLIDDPFRSLAWLVRKRGGFYKSSLSFSEFHWAEFFKRENIQFSFNDKKSVLAAIDRALRLCRSGKARDLPGFISC